MKRVCVICGKQFETKYSRQITCSKECSQQEHSLKNAERVKNQNPYRVCKICGKQFIPIGKEQFCSEECRAMSIKNSKAKIIEHKHISLEIKKRLSSKEKILKKQNQKKTYICAFCGKKFDRNYNEIYCSDECRNKARKLSVQKTRKKKKQILKDAVCPICGKTFTPTSRNQKYCSHECYIKKSQEMRAEIFRSKHKANYSICSVCGKEFPQVQHFKKYCSAECRNIAKQQKKKPEFVQKTCIICGKPFMTKSRSTLCCSDECHKKYRVIVQTKYAHKKQKEKREEKLKIKKEKERQLALQLQLKREQKEAKKRNTIRDKIKFPKYMRQRIFSCLDKNQFDIIFLTIENRLAKEFNFVGEINKGKIFSILSENSDNIIENLEEYLTQIIYFNIKV